MLDQKGVKDLGKESNKISKILIINLFLINLFITFNGLTKDRPILTTIWDVKLGMSWEDIPVKDFMFFACGTDGGPPGKPLENKFADYHKCTPNEYGLKEVYFEYDDEAYYWALAYEDTFSSTFQGTRVFSHLSVISLLFNDDGIVHGIKIITDDRAPHNERKGSPGLFLKLEGTFGKDLWECTDLKIEEGEIPVGESFMKKICFKNKFDKVIFLRGDYYRKKGQTAFDRVTKKHTTGYFESRARLEVYSHDINFDLNNHKWSK